MSDEDKTTQTAVDETKTSATPDAKVDSAREDEDLDKLLAEYDGSSKSTASDTAKPEPKGTADDPVAALTVEVRELRGERQRERFRQDMDTTVKNVRGNLDPELFDDALVESWIDGEARKDPRLSQVWTNRHDNPKQFQKVVGTLGSKFAKKFGKLGVDKAATEDREAVTAAVRGASTKAPAGQAPDYSKLSNNEFQAEKDRLFGG